MKQALFPSEIGFWPAFSGHDATENTVERGFNVSPHAVRQLLRFDKPFDRFYVECPVIYGHGLRPKHAAERRTGQKSAKGQNRVSVLSRQNSLLYQVLLQAGAFGREGLQHLLRRKIVYRFPECLKQTTIHDARI